MLQKYCGKSLVPSIFWAATMCGILGAAELSTVPEGDSEHWETRQLTDEFWAEGAAVADVNGDSHPDILCGPYWYQGPEFTERHAIYPATESFRINSDSDEPRTVPGFPGALSHKNAYSDNFVVIADDCNGDGWVDYLVVGFPGKETWWYENPGKDWQNTLWKQHLILQSTDNESPQFVDIDGDGKPDLLAMSGGQIGFATRNSDDPYQAWTWKPITPGKEKRYHRFTHGLGVADINGDGKIDILEQRGWWEQPQDWDGSSEWKFHAVDFGPGGAQMCGMDVTGNRTTDVISSLSAHEWGLAWFEQQADGNWLRHLLTDTPKERGSTGIALSQMHAVRLADLNGDGILDIITGKRFWAHGPAGDPEPNATPTVYAFLTRRDASGVKFVPQLISSTSGVGVDLAVADINGDGKLDVVTGNKLGLFIHIQK